MNCIICDTELKKETAWASNCPGCDFWVSELESGAGRGIDGLETLRRQNFKILCNHFETLRPLKGINCLEVGCAEGWFLDEANSRGANCIGIEPSEVSEIALKAGHKVKKGFFPDVLDPDTQFDLIIFNDVFEHLPDPVFAIKECENQLAAGGFLILNLPDSKGLFFRIARFLIRFGKDNLFNRLWQKGFPSPHLTYFNERNLVRFINRYTTLDKKKSFPIPTFHRQGLKDRIEASHTGLTGSLIFLVLYFVLPIIQRLPQDTVTVIFQKPGEK